MITVDVEQVKAVITNDTEKVRYIDYITKLSQALGLADHKITNDVAWRPATHAKEADRERVASGGAGTWLLHQREPPSRHEQVTTGAATEKS